MRSPAAPGLCVICGTPGGVPVHHLPSVPVNSCLLVGSREEAVNTPRGVLELVMCPTCGYVGNRAFDAGLTVYSGRYEDSQAFYGTFIPVCRRPGWAVGGGCRGSPVPPSWRSEPAG